MTASIPTPWQRFSSYRRRFGWRAAWRRVWLELQGRGPVLPGQPAPATEPGAVPTVAQWLQARFPNLSPLRTFRVPSAAPSGRRRVSLVTDSIGPGSLFGGVGTALILATLVANRRGADLRIVTRTEPPVAAALDHVLQVYGLSLQGESVFRHAPLGEGAPEIDLLDDELVITTSWWTTAAALPAVGEQRLVYLLQEDERMFYPFGDERLRCEQLLRHPGLRIVINTELLRRHFVADGLSHYAEKAMAFEPAFPAAVFHPRQRAGSGRLRFVFYARPNNARNLFFLGLQAIDAAIARGVLDPAAWDFVFVGKDIPELQLAGGVRPQRHENLDWAAYADLVGGADLGLSLMATPHPSYPPLDLVASGAVVVSNRHGPKQDLSHWSHNLILCEPSVDALVDGLARAAALAQDRPRRERQYRETALARDWSATLAPVVEQLARGA